MAKKTRSKRPVRKKSAPARKRRPSKKRQGADPRLNGWITHTEFASSNPGAFKIWCADVLGWTFKPSFPMPDGGEYLLFMYSKKGGGGVRPISPGEEACTVPYVQVGNVRTTFEKALREGAEAIMSPERIMGDLVIAVVRAPGGVAVGLAGPK